MSKNVIYCFSGTGNCLDIAKNIAKVLGDTDIVMMRRLPAVRDVHEAERVGFVFPCYAGGLPGEVERFVRRLLSAFPRSTRSCRCTTTRAFHTRARASG